MWHAPSSLVSGVYEGKIPYMAEFDSQREAKEYLAGKIVA
jgi:hypothetical protein